MGRKFAFAMILLIRKEIFKIYIISFFELEIVERWKLRELPHVT